MGDWATRGLPGDAGVTHTPRGCVEGNYMLPDLLIPLAVHPLLSSSRRLLQRDGSNPPHRNTRSQPSTGLRVNNGDPTVLPAGGCASHLAAAPLRAT